MSKSMVKSLVALLTLTTIFGGIGTALAQESRVIDNPELVTISNTASGNGCKLTLTASAYDYLTHYSKQSAYLTPYYPGCSYTLDKGISWSASSGTTISCTARGLFIVNSTGVGFYLTPKVVFE